MDEQDLAAVLQVGEELSMFKLLLVSIQCLWMYDYLLTFGDEVKYAWSGRRSWVFAIFIANRYTPVLHLVWLYTTMFHYRKPFCQATKWIPILHSTSITIFAQVAVALRVYAVTGRNKRIGAVLALFVAAQFSHGIFSIVWIALGPLQPFPEIKLDPFEVCFYKLWNLGELIYYNLTIAFDLLAFLIILVTAKRSRGSRYPGMPSILDVVVRYSTNYFLLIFFSQLLAELFVLFAPHGIQLLPGTANTILVPVMASRLMLSLKKATVQPKILWSLDTMTSMGRGRSAGGRTIIFAPRVPRGLHEASRAPVAPNEGDMELGAMPRSPPSLDSHYGR